MKYEKWFDNMVDKLEEQYSEYLKEVDVTIEKLISFEEFAYNKYESMQDDRDDEAYERFRDENR